jgi:hypothetical protein
MIYARRSECAHAVQVGKVSNDIMMMWLGTHIVCLAQAYCLRARMSYAPVVAQSIVCCHE